MFREKAKKLEKQYANKAYENLIQFLASDPKVLTSQGASFLPLESEMKNIVGRVIAEFELSDVLDNNPQIQYLEDGDKDIIPLLTQQVFVYGEVSTRFNSNVDAKSATYYIKNLVTCLNMLQIVTICCFTDGNANRLAVRGIGRFSSKYRYLLFILIQ